MFPKGSFARSVGILSGGTAFAQLLSILALPLLTRLYSPADFSLLAVYSAFIGLITVVSCLRFNIAIPLPSDDADALTLLALSLFAACVVSFCCVIPIILVPKETAAFFGQPTLEAYLWMFPAGAFLGSTYNALQYWATRKKRFGDIARTRVTQSLGSLTTQIGFGLFSSTAFGLLFGSMLANGLGLYRLLRVFTSNEVTILKQLTKAKFFSQASKYKRYPFFSVPESFFNTAGLQLPIIVIAALATGNEAGLLLLAMKVVGLPTRLIGSAVAQVFNAEAPQKLREGTLAKFSRKTMWSLFVTSAPLFVSIGVVAPFVFPLIFGPEWENAGWLVTWLTPWFILQFVVTPVSMLLHVTNRMILAMSLQFFGALVRVGAVLIAYFADHNYLAEAYAVGSLVFYGIYLLVLLLLSNDTFGARTNNE